LKAYEINLPLRFRWKLTQSDLLHPLEEADPAFQYQDLGNRHKINSFISFTTPLHLIHDLVSPAFTAVQIPPVPSDCDMQTKS
jgi:hypothetical protein